MSQKFISVSNDSSKEKSDIKNNIAGKKKQMMMSQKCLLGLIKITRSYRQNCVRIIFHFLMFTIMFIIIQVNIKREFTRRIPFIKVK